MQSNVQLSTSDASVAPWHRLRQRVGTALATSLLCASPRPSSRDVDQSIKNVCRVWATANKLGYSSSFAAECIQFINCLAAQKRPARSNARISTAL
eukprot:5811808-Pleurochrysis_carterae.AAC.2